MDVGRVLWRVFLLWQPWTRAFHECDDDGDGCFVVDDSPTKAMTKEEQLRDAVFLVFANKQDLPNACPAAKLVCVCVCLSLIHI